MGIRAGGLVESFSAHRAISIGCNLPVGQKIILQ